MKKEKLISLLLMLIMLIGVLNAGMSVTAFAESTNTDAALATILQGSGTEKNPFLVSDEETYALVHERADAYWKLTNDVTLSAVYPIDEFTGTFDGDGYTLTIEDFEASINTYGLIKSNYGTIKNLHIELSEVVLSKTASYLGNYNYGTIAIDNYGIVEKCSVKGNIKFNITENYNYTYRISMLVCDNNLGGVIENCYTDCNITDVIKHNAYGTTHISTFTLFNLGTIKNSYVSSSYNKYYYSNVGVFHNAYDPETETHGELINSFWDKTLNTEASPSLEDGACSTTIMKLKNMYIDSDWDFVNTWAMTSSANDGYPYLQNERSIVVDVENIFFSDSEYTVAEGKSITPKYEIVPSSANTPLTWSTSSKYVATVENGVVKGVSEGTATITATTAKGLKFSFTVRVITSSAVSVTAITLNKSSLSLNTGDTATLTATVTPSNATNKGVMWTSSKSAVATVSNGVVTAVAPGTTTITAKTLDGNYTATCTVTVKEEQLPSDGYTNIDDYLTYTTTAGKATITGVTGTISGDVTFSATIDGYPIVTIGNSAFYGSNITGIVIPEGVSSIDDKAFSGCYSLQFIKLPETLTKIGTQAFDYCESLKSIFIPKNVETINTNSFTGCYALEEITVDSNHSWLESDNGILIANGSQLVVYPAGKTNSTYTIPDNITKIYGYAFDSNDNLKSIHISAGVNEILCSFYDCSALETITVDGSNSVYSSIDGVLFDKAKSTLIFCPVNKDATTYTVPSGVKAIGSQAFYSNNTLEEIIISDGVETLSELAFSFCTSLKSIVIPKSVTNIEAYAFYSYFNDEPLSDVYYKGSESDWAKISIGSNNSLLSNASIHYNYDTIDDEDNGSEGDGNEDVDTEGLIDFGVDANGINWYFYENGLLKIVGSGEMQDYTKTSEIPWYAEKANITEIGISNGITHIGTRSFYNCIEAKKATIPSSVTSIGSYAFRNCEVLTIYGESGSYAQNYAKLSNIPFINTKTIILPDLDVELTNGTSKWLFDISCNEITEDASVYAAIYDEGGKMLSAVCSEYTAGDINTLIMPKNTSAKYAKIFVWKHAIPVSNSLKVDF